MNKKTLSLRKKFFVFLEQRGVLELYKKYAIYFDPKQPDIWIVGDFTWADTQEGVHFWSDIYLDWCRIMNRRK